jgi:phage shock protein C
MNVAGKRFEVDREEGKFLGVCAGLANATGIDATIVRVGFVLGTLFLGGLHGFPWTFALYGALALIGHRRGERDDAGDRIGRADESRERLRSLDLRMRAIETHAASNNSALAREIDALR